jgi:glycosyltransferase involved in cell wall biosynthesis
MRSKKPSSSAAGNREVATSVAFLPAGDRFEDFFDRIGVSLDDFRLQQSGGWLFNFVEGLRQQGIGTVLVFSSARVGSTVRFVHQPSGARVCVLPVPKVHVKARNFASRRDPRSQAWFSIGSYLALSVSRLTRELRRYGCVALLCQEFETPRFDVCVLIGRLLRLPVFATYQGAMEQHAGPEKLIRPLTVRGCAGLAIGASVEIGRVRARYRVPERKIGHIPNAVDVQLWSPGDRAAARSALGIEPDTQVVAWHGRVQIKRKGLDLLIQAWHLLRAARAGRDLRLLLIGWGRDGELLRGMIDELPSPEEVVWIDRYVHDPNEIAGYLRAADVYCIPSRHEGFAVAALEALACGLPVVASDVPGISDVFRDGDSSGGVIVPPGASDDLARALGDLLDDPARRETLGVAARRRVEDKFTVEEVGAQLWDFMRKQGVRHRPST